MEEIGRKRFIYKKSHKVHAVQNNRSDAQEEPQA